MTGLRGGYMKICYHCDVCGADIADLEMEEIDEKRLGFDCLTGEERRDIIEFDPSTDIMHVKTFCDVCVERLGLHEAAHADALYKSNLIH